jgi:hypothetical protein
MADGWASRCVDRAGVVVGCTLAKDSGSSGEKEVLFMPRHVP